MHIFGPCMLVGALSLRVALAAVVAAIAKRDVGYNIRRMIK